MMRMKDDLGGFYFINEDSLQIKNGDFIFLVGEIYFPSWESGFLWLGLMWVFLSVGWRRKPSGDKGAAPPRAQAPSPCRGGWRTRRRLHRATCRSGTPNAGSTPR